jgi:hypothetical protein
MVSSINIAWLVSVNNWGVDYWSSDVSDWLVDNSGSSLLFLVGIVSDDVGWLFRSPDLTGSDWLRDEGRFDQSLGLDWLLDWL